MQLQKILTSMFSTRSRKRASITTLASLRRRASRLGVAIEVARDGAGRCYWLHGTGWEDDNFCASHDEIIEKLNRIER